MIQDIEGATSEPTRRWHVVVLSGAVAALSLVLLAALLVPAPMPSNALKARVPSATAASLLTIVSGATTSFQPNPPSQLRVDAGRLIVCVDDSRPGSPYYVVFEGNRQVISVPFEGRNGSLSMPCATSTTSVPRINRAR